MNQNKVVGILEQALSAGYFKPQCEDFLSLLSQDGLTAVEVEEFERQKQLRLFAGSVEPIVVALLAVAKAEQDSQSSCLHLVEGEKARSVPVGTRIQGENPLVVFLNSGPSKSDPDDLTRRIWAPFGQLRLQAIVVQIGKEPVEFDLEKSKGQVLKPTGQVTLYLGMHDVPDDFVEGFSYFSLDTIGRTSSHARFARKPRVGRRILEQLGVLSLEDVVPTMDSDGGTAEQMLGFPGAFQYLAQTMPALPGYLRSI